MRHWSGLTTITDLTDNTMEKITFQYKDFPTYRAVAFNAPLSYFATQTKMDAEGKMTQFLNEFTIKDCRNIDQTVYFAKGRVQDSEMCRLIDLYNKSLGQEGWTKVDESKKPTIIL